MPLPDFTDVTRSAPIVSGPVFSTQESSLATQCEHNFWKFVFARARVFVFFSLHEERNKTTKLCLLTGYIRFMSFDQKTHLDHEIRP